MFERNCGVRLCAIKGAPLSAARRAPPDNGGGDRDDPGALGLPLRFARRPVGADATRAAEASAAEIDAPEGRARTSTLDERHRSSVAMVACPVFAVTALSPAQSPIVTTAGSDRVKAGKRGLTRRDRLRSGLRVGMEAGSGCPKLKLSPGRGGRAEASTGEN